MNGYFAVQLKKSDSKLVSKRAIFPNLVSDHITLAYKPSKRLYNKFIKLVDKEKEESDVDVAINLENESKLGK